MEIRKTHLLVEAEVMMKLLGVEEPQKIVVKRIPRTWVWDYSDRPSQEVAAVLNWLIDTFGNNLQGYEIVYLGSSPVKEGEDQYPMLLMETDSEEVINKMVTEKEVVWGDGSVCQEPALPEQIKYKTDLSDAWGRLEAAFEEVDAAVEERLDSMIPLKGANEELKRILKSTIENDGKMTAGQIGAFNRHFGWEKTDDN